MAKDGLTVQQRRFVEAYQGKAHGNATKAAILAGYSKKTAGSQGQRLLKNVEIAKAIQKQDEREEKAAIASREERQEFLTGIMRSTEEKTVNRIKATEILGKMNGDFLERIEHSGGFVFSWEDGE